MITTLAITNFTIIDHLELDFNTGFTTLTGETGAGKSIIIDAIAQLLGKQGATSLIKTGCDKATIQAIFEQNDAQTIITKTIHRTKASSIKVNGEFITTKELKAMAPSLVQILGQHDQFSLMDPDTHLEWIDQSDVSIAPILSAYKTQYADLQRLLSERHALLEKQASRQQQHEFLTFQIDDIAQHHLVADEDDTLTEQKKAIKDTNALTKRFASIQTHTATITDTCLTLTKHAEALTDDGLQQSLQTAIDQTVTLFEDIAYKTSTKQQELTRASALNIDDIESRLDVIFKLKTKYNCNSVNDILEKLANYRQQKQALTNLSENTTALTKQIDTLTTSLHTQANALHIKRQTAAQTLQHSVNQHLADLELPKTGLHIQIDTSDALLSTGQTQVSFQIQANPGIPPQPIQKIASGGELSRIMLALSCTTHHNSPKRPTLIFDEIDTGIGGLTGHSIGKKLAHLASTHQVFCITHLTQVAQKANHHIVIAKNLHDDKTSVSATLLSPEDVTPELKRMAGGDETLLVLK